MATKSSDSPKQATGEADLGQTSNPVLTYWYSPPVSHQAALAAEIAAQPALAVHVTSNLVSMNPNYVPGS